MQCLNVYAHGSSLKELIINGSLRSLLRLVIKTYVSEELSKKDPGGLVEVNDAAITLQPAHITHFKCSRSDSGFR